MISRRKFIKDKKRRKLFKHKMDQLNLLCLLSFSMLVGSFLSGSIPMAFKLSDSKSRLLALMGSGILVGTALAIIIPEGINSIYAQTDPLDSQTAGGLPSVQHSKQTSQQQPAQEPVDTWTIGVSLVAGFVLMLLIDQFSIYQNGGEDHSHQSTSAQHSYSLANQEDDGYDIGEEEEDMRASPAHYETTSETRPIRAETHRVLIRGLDESPSQSSGASNKSRPNHAKLLPQQQVNRTTATTTKVTPTLGLVIHASADGIALGAAATTSHRHVEMIIFLAIMLHKAPAAFSLVVFLLHRGLKHSTIRRHLMAFSLSAPLAALVTYFGLSQSGKEALRRNNATGIAMLFSAGTFLYVATVHVLPELVHNRLLTPKELLLVVGGSFLPILLAQTV